MTIAKRLQAIRNTLPQHVKLVAVSKNHSINSIMEAYEVGQRIFGENKAQELSTKQPLLPADIEWHFIGHLQSNKVKFITPYVSMIHGVDSLKLLKEINKEALKSNRTIRCLLQFHIAEEDTKFGFSEEEATEMLTGNIFATLNNIKICGVMGMATFTEDTAQVQREFKSLAILFNILKEKFFTNNEDFKELSMGMSDDYLIAIEEGSTLVRIGTTIFGSRY